MRLRKLKKVKEVTQGKCFLECRRSTTEFYHQRLQFKLEIKNLGALKRGFRKNNQQWWGSFGM